jgi:hypothetical protein
MTRCKACGSDYRKGTLVFLLTPGGLKGARVCQSCASGGVLLVAPKIGPMIQKKTVRSDGVERALRMLNTYAKVAKSGSNAAGTNIPVRDVMLGRAEGIETAIEVLKRECGGGS